MAKKTQTDKSSDSLEQQKKYKYVLDWIEESVEIRRAQNEKVNRTVRAWQGKPSRNRYKQTISSLVSEVAKNDQAKAEQIKTACNDLPEKASMVVHNAVETIVSMTQGGVGQYEFGPYDATTKADVRLMDRMGAAAKFFYQKEKVDSILPQLIRNAVLAGSAHLHLKHDKKNNKKVLTIIDSSEMITDPKRFKTSCERFIGFHTRASFREVSVRARELHGNFVIDTINEAEVYVSQITQALNSVLDVSSIDTYENTALRRDLDIFYRPAIQRISACRKDDPKYMYSGDEVEITYLYDLQNDKYFEIINRKYIIVAKDSDLKKTIDCKYWDYSGEKPKEKTIKKDIKLDHPFIELPFTKTFWDAYPITPLFFLLDDYDDLCAMESVLYHNLSIMAPLTFVGQSSDAEKVSRIASVSGEVVEGLPQTFGVLDKTHDITPVVTMIQRIEEKIKRTLKAVDPFEMQAMIGDRASAKEVVAMSGQVSQGVNPFIANIETAMATLGDKFFKLEVIFGEDTFPFTQDGKYAELSSEEMAQDYEILAKLQSSIKLEQEANARRAIELIQFLSGNEAVDQQQFLGTTIPIALNSLVNREQAMNMVSADYRPLPDEVLSIMRQRAQEEARKDSIDQLDLSSYSNEELDELIAQQSEMGANLAENPLVPPAAIDPVTGMPIEQGMPAVDPATGMPIQDPMNDPMAMPPADMPIDPMMDPSIGASIPPAMATSDGGSAAFNDVEGAGFVL